VVPSEFTFGIILAPTLIEPPNSANLIVPFASASMLGIPDPSATEKIVPVKSFEIEKS
jgi:hypothetical protein